MKFLFKIFCILGAISLTSSIISEFCEKDEDCNENNYCYEQTCHHKSILPIDFRDTIGFLTIILGSALSNAGGIGGGGLFIPILIIIMEFYTHEAIPISKLMIFAGSLTTFILNLKFKHPSRDSICLDYNIAILFVPMLLLGTVIGVSLNKVMPSFIILILLTFVLVINTYKITSKAIKLYKYENDERLINENKIEKKNKQIKDREMSQWASNPFMNSTNEKQLDLNAHLVTIELQRDKSLLQIKNIGILLLSYIGIFTLSLLRGSNYFKSIIGIETCSFSYWIIYFLFVPFALIITAFVIRKVRRDTEYRIGIGFPFDQHDIIWKGSVLYIFPMYAFFAGVIAGLVGIGGGLIIGPILIELGVNPVISTVTSNFLVLFTSSSTSIQFTLMGMMNINYGGICTLFSIVGSFIGTVTVHYLLLITKRESVLVIVLSFVLLLSSILLPGYSLYESLNKLSYGIHIWDFNTPC